MEHFKYSQNTFSCDQTSLSEVAEKFGTPFYAYSIDAFVDRYKELYKAFRSLKPLICFSVKSNSNLSVMKSLVDAGAGLDIVSGGELFRAKKVGADPKKIVFASVGKHEGEIAEAISAGILMFNVETEPELEVINRVASQKNIIQSVTLRINPDVKPKTHKYITTGSKENKFGMSFETAFRIFTESYRYPHLRFIGIHLHIGSQIMEAAPFIKAINRAADFVGRLRKSDIPIEYLNIGGGLGITYSDEKPQTAQQFAKKVKPLIEKLNLKLILEPGRYISGNSGVLVTKILYWKQTNAKTFAIVDAGMNDLLRPSIYGAYHEIIPMNKPSARVPKIPVDVVGPICESGDFLGKDRQLPRMKEGDLLVVKSAGAYGFTMSGNYNSRPRACEIVIRKSKYEVAKRRETYNDLIRGESIAKL